MKGLIIIPAHNEEKNIGFVLDSLKNNQNTFQIPMDIVVILDYCTDSTEQVVREKGVSFVNLPCHLGYAVALQTGLKFGIKKNYDFCIFFDADGQHAVDDIPKMIEKYYNSKSDMIIGSRFLNRSNFDKISILRKFGIFLFKFLTTILTRNKFTDTTSGFRLLSKRAMKILSNELLGDFNAETIVYLYYLGLKLEEIPIMSKSRLDGISMHSFSHAAFYPFKTFLLMLVLSSKRPKLSL